MYKFYHMLLPCLFFNVINGWKMYTCYKIYLLGIVECMSLSFYKPKFKNMYHFCFENMSIWSFYAAKKVLHYISSTKLWIDHWQKWSVYTDHWPGWAETMTCVHIHQKNWICCRVRCRWIWQKHKTITYPDVATVASEGCRKEWLTKHS